MKEQMLKIAKDLEQDIITEIEAQNLLLGLFGVINRRELLKHYSNFLYENKYLIKPNVLMEYELSLL